MIFHVGASIFRFLTIHAFVRRADIKALAIPCNVHCTRMIISTRSALYRQRYIHCEWTSVELLHRRWMLSLFCRMRLRTAFNHCFQRLPLITNYNTVAC